MTKHKAAQTIEPRVFAWRNPWFRWSVVAFFATSAAAILVGFVWLPSAQADFGAQGLWASVCRAAGVPASWGQTQAQPASNQRSTGVVLSQVADEERGRGGREAAVGRGATLALKCTMCHGARGMSDADAPNLAGQYAAVVIKQLIDYQRGDRSSAVMQALAANLSEADMRDIAAYYAELPNPHEAGARADGPVPALVAVGDPMRNIAPCASCHGGIGAKLGAPRLQGMPKNYLSVQLRNFASGLRKNDSHGQMRHMAHALSVAEVEAVTSFYARAGQASQR